MEEKERTKHEKGSCVLKFWGGFQGPRTLKIVLPSRRELDFDVLLLFQKRATKESGRAGFWGGPAECAGRRGGLRRGMKTDLEAGPARRHSGAADRFAHSAGPGTRVHSETRTRGWHARVWPKMATRRLREAPRWPQKAPRWPQDGFKTAPRDLKMASRWLQDGLKTAQETPKTAQEASKTAQDGPKRLPRRRPKGKNH